MATFRAGRLLHRIQIQEQQRVPDGGGGYGIEWVTLRTVWAHVEPLSAREFVASQAVQSEVTARITIRYRDDITPDMRILHRGKIYHIRGVLADHRSGLEYLTLPCSEGVPT